MIETITFKGKEYPIAQSKGFAAKYAIPFAIDILFGIGIDIGCNREEWAFPNATVLVDPSFNLPPPFDYNATNLPENPMDDEGQWDYIFSSHLLEHLEDFVSVLDCWHEFIKPGGILFLYLPDANAQSYWRPWHNRKHVNYFTPEILKQYFEDMSNMWELSYVSGTDANCSFIAYAQKVS